MSFNQNFLTATMPAQILDPNRPRKVVFYGRVSTQHEAQVDALENQMQWYEEQAHYHPNWTVVGRYIDEGITGTLAEKRPAFMQMLEDAQAHKFDLIVTREVCRFARNTVITLQVTRSLREIGVEVYFAQDNIWTCNSDGELRLSLMSTLAQEESRKISERVRAGQAVSRANGVLYGSGNIIGYDRVGDHYEINEEQAETVRIIFHLYSQGLGQLRIAKELSRLGRKDGRGNVNWSCCKISRILRNATYMGYNVYNKSSTTSYLSKRRVNNLDESTYIYVKGTHEPIISEELWHACEHIRKNHTSYYQTADGEMRRKGSKEAKLLWTRKLRCRCGCSYHINYNRPTKDGTKSRNYLCVKRSSNPSARAVVDHALTEQLYCDAALIREWKLDMMAQMIFEKVWGDSKPLLLHTCEMIEKCAKAQQYQTQQSLQDQKAKQTELKERKLKYSRMYASGALDDSEYQRLINEVRQEQDEMNTPKPAKKVTQPKLNIREIRKALERVLDVSGPVIDDELVEEFVEVVTPVEDYHFRWKLNFGPVKTKFDRTNMMKITDEPFLQFTIDFDMAKAYRQKRGLCVTRGFCTSNWHDLNVEVYL